MLRAVLLTLGLSMLRTGVIAHAAAPLQAVSPALTAEAIMSRVAVNQDRTETARAQFVYVQHAKVQSRKGDTVMCEEITDMRVTPSPNSQTKTLLSLSGHVRDGHRVVHYTAAAQVPALTTLNNLRDRARPLLIFAPKPDYPQLAIQLRTLEEHAAEARERDLVPVALPFNNPGPTATQLAPNDAEAARRRFHVAPGEFVVILIGKDGGEKLRSSKPLSMQKLQETIDQMPLRQDEMRAGQKK